MQLELREYQKDGINLIRQKRNFGLFWQQRLGKTIVAIKSVEEFNKVIFAVPNNTILHWFVEIVNNCYGKDVKIAPKERLKRFKFYEEFNNAKDMWIVISYDMIAQDFYHKSVQFSPFDYIVLDEAHFLRNSKSKRTKGILKLRLNAKYALALSGTPAVNNAIDILKIFKFLFPNDNFGYKYIYKKKYFELKYNEQTRKKEYVLRNDMVIEWDKMLKQYCDIKKVKDYLEWLPEIINKTIKLEMNKDQYSHYLKMLIESKRILKENKEKKENSTITQIVRLQQICLDPKLLNINASSIKIDWLNDFLETLFEENDDEYVIVFTSLSSVYKVNEFPIAKKFPIAFLTGEQNDKEKQNIIHQFQSRKIRVLFSNIKVASLGLTLDEATCTIFLNKSWNPIDNEQASFRMVDTKQKAINKPKLIINVICNNSIDEKIDNVLNDKKTKTSIIYEIERYIEEIDVK